MDTILAAEAFATLSSPTRLNAYRLLVRAGRQGKVAGELATLLDLPPANLSFHLKALVAADLASVTQEGRFQRYRANLERMQDLVAFLSRECCVDEGSSDATCCDSTPEMEPTAHAVPATV
jgi:arsenate reductase